MKNELKSIKKASFVKRLLALIMDGAVALFVFFGFFVFVFSPIANKGLGMAEATKTGAKIQVDSGLYVPKEEGSENYVALSKYDFESKDEYLAHLKSYYLEFKTGLVEEGRMAASDYNVPIKNGDVEVLPKDYYTEAWFNEKMSGVIDVDSAKQASLDALNDLSKYLTPYQKTINLCKLFIAGCSYIMSFSIFYILVPLLYKNGETFGKKTMGIGLVTKDGYDVKKRQIVLRQLFLLIYVGLFSFYLGVGYTSFATLGLGILIYFVVAFISKTNRSIADYLAYTYTIDTKNSVWFKDKEQEEKKENIVETNLTKYNKNEELDKHIIQVGSTIVNEEVKKEMAEQEQKKKTQK